MIPGFKLFISEREESERPPRHEVKRRACSRNFIRTRLASVAGVFVSGRAIVYAAAAASGGKRRRSEVTLLFRALTADLPHLLVPSRHPLPTPHPPLLTRRLAFIPLPLCNPSLLTSLLAGQPANDPAHSGSPETRFNRSSGRDWVRKSEAKREEGGGDAGGRKPAAGRWLLYAPPRPPPFSTILTLLVQMLGFLPRM